MRILCSLPALLLCTFSVFSQVTNILLDYDGVDELAAADSNGDYLRDFLDMNSRFPDSPFVNGITWAVVAFDSLFDAGSETAYSYNDKALTLDSLLIYFTHKNHSGYADTILVSVYKDDAGLETDSQPEITNTVLYDTMIITASSLTDSNAVSSLNIRPHLQLPQGQRFLTGVHYYGAFSDTFKILYGYADFCGGDCYAHPSVFENNSFSRVIYWDGGTNLSGINIFYNCDFDANEGEPEDCELFYAQNLGISAYVSFGTDTTDSTSLVHLPVIPSFNLYPNPAGDVVTVQLNDFSTSATLSLFDTRGRRLLSQPVISRQTTLNLSALPGGLYFVEITSGNRHPVRAKLVKN